MPTFSVDYEANGKKYRIIIEAKSEKVAINKCLKTIKELGLESEAEIYRVREIK